MSVPTTFATERATVNQPRPVEREVERRHDDFVPSTRALSDFGLVCPDGCIRFQQDSSSRSGGWLEVSLADDRADFTIDLVSRSGVGRTLACFRTNACWMHPWTGSGFQGLPSEVQLLLYEFEDEYVVLIPGLDGAHRFSITGVADESVRLVAHTGDDSLTGREFRAVALVRGVNPYALIREAAELWASSADGPTLLKSKQPASFIRRLGWCSYNAFYSDISHDAIVDLLAQYHDEGVPAGFAIIDEGWMISSEDQRLASLDADPAKFPGGLRGLSAELRSRCGLQDLLAWHCFAGYWRGVETADVAGGPVVAAPIGVPAGTPQPSQAAANSSATVGESFYPWDVLSRPVRIPERTLADYYDKLHRTLAESGVSGVKIDAMSWAEVHGRGRGGRVGVMRDLVRAAEYSTAAHLDGNLLNCSSCSTEFYLSVLSATVTRTSQDYFPDRPETHGQHLWINAMVSMFLGEFVLPDWDMFQTGHESGAFHAAARAISGGPVYTTDQPGRHDTALLRRLAVHDALVPLSVQPARPCRDMLFADPTQDQVPLKVFNYNRVGSVIGIFHCLYSERGDRVIRAAWRPDDVEGIGPGPYAVWSESDQCLDIVRNCSEQQCVKLERLGFEILTVTTIEHDFAPIGLVDLLNPGGAVLSREDLDSRTTITLLGGGRFVAYSATAPAMINAYAPDGTSMTGLITRFDPKSGMLEIDVPTGSGVLLEVHRA
ncbi:MAG: Sip1-related alpha-galactosidase [Planctomycetota bacterium]